MLRRKRFWILVIALVSVLTFAGYDLAQLQNGFEQQKIIDLDFSNPYKKEMVPKALKQTTIPILEDTIFEEVLRLDTSTTMIHSRLMNAKGELVIYSDDQILLFNDKGELICQKKIPANYRGQASLGYHTKSGVFPSTDVFFINNHIIPADHSFVELPFQLLSKLHKIIFFLLQDLCAYSLT